MGLADSWDAVILCNSFPIDEVADRIILVGETSVGSGGAG